MLLKESGIEICFVSRNKRKFIEARELLKDYNINLVMTPLDVKLELQSENLEEIALYAAILARTILRRAVVVEDTGLYINALKGFPGPYSSYVYRTIGLKGILKLMEGEQDRRAYFKSVVVLVYKNIVKCFTGTCFGSISYYIRGVGGFGFDPIFVPMGEKRTFAEMSIEEKNLYSHRGIAFRMLGEWVSKNINLFYDKT